MTFKECMGFLFDGGKVRRPYWGEGEYIILTDDGFIDESGKIYTPESDVYSDNEWEEFIEDSCKNIKVFISLPMHGRTVEEVEEEKIKYLQGFERFYKKELGEEHVKIVDVNNDIGCREGFTRVQNLGASIYNMDSADIIIFANGWEYTKGCMCENVVAYRYMYNEKGEHRWKIFVAEGYESFYEVMK